MTIKLQEEILSLYPEFKKIYGPYIRKDGRKIVILYDGEKRSARQYAKVLLEVKLKRRLIKGEEVDHKNEDFTDDSVANLQILNASENRRKSIRNIFGDKRKSKCAICDE